jgi:hypothetical protein
MWPNLCILHICPCIGCFKVDGYIYDVYHLLTSLHRFLPILPDCFPKNAYIAHIWRCSSNCSPVRRSERVPSGTKRLQLFSNCSFTEYPLLSVQPLSAHDQDCRSVPFACCTLSYPILLCTTPFQLCATTSL